MGRVNATGQARPPPPRFTFAICSNISFDSESPRSRIWTFPSDYRDGTPPAIHLDGTSASGSDDLCSIGDAAGQHPLVSDMACCFYRCTCEVLPRSRSGGKKCYFLSGYKPTPWEMKETKSTIDTRCSLKTPLRGFLWNHRSYIHHLCPLCSADGTWRIRVSEELLR